MIASTPSKKQAIQDYSTPQQLSEKTALDTARAGILNDIRQRGKVYDG
ncbi:MAG: hypothetical protein R8K48_03635 [Gallionella sp.]